MVRFVGLDHQSFWYDEALTTAVLQPSLFDTYDLMAAREANPPAYFTLAWAWTRVFGEGDYAVRALSALVGTLTVPVAYGAARNLVSRRAGVITAAVVAVSPFLVWYSQEARSYGLAVFAAALSFYWFTRIAAGERRPRELYLWAGTSVLAVATHYFAAFPVIVEALLILWLVGPLRHAVVSMAVVGLSGLLLIPLALHQQSDDQVDWIRDEPLADRASGTVRAFVSGPEGAPGAGLGLLAALLLVAGLVLALRARGAERKGVLMAGSLVAGGFGAALACVAVGVDFFYFRNMIVLWIPLAVVAAAGFAATGRAGIAAAVALAVVLLAIHVRVQGDESHQRTNWRDAIAWLGEPEERRALITSPAHAVLVPAHYGANLAFAQGRAVPVREIAVLAAKRTEPFEPGQRLFGFTVTDVRSFPGLEVARLRSPEPRRVRARAVDGSLIGARDAQLVLEEPEG